MKFSYPFLRKLFPGMPPKEKTAELLNMRAFEVESVEGDTMDIKLPANLYSSHASHAGIAREVAAVMEQKFAYRAAKRDHEADAPAHRGLLTVRVDDRAACPRYAVRVFDLPKVGMSPKEIQRALVDCGLKPINAVVDIMNYVMLETGQPLHAFDYAKLAGARGAGQAKTIVVRRAKKGETIETLDGQAMTLDPAVLVIADAAAPQAIAGIKGGAASGVDAATRRIVVEAANFEPIGILTTSRRLKLPTDAAIRFSHGMSPALVDWGIARATELLLEAGATLIDAADIASTKPAEEKMEFDCARYEALIGAPVEPRTARLRFERLGFVCDEPKKGNGGAAKFTVRIPPWRTDIENMEGLIEEVARLEGYDTLPVKAPVFSILPAADDDTVALKTKVRTVLAHLGLSEAYSSSFLGPHDLAGAYDESALTGPENPVSEDKKYLRPSLIPLLRTAARLNMRFFDRAGIFEVGKVFTKEGGKVRERLSLGIVLAEKRNPKVALELKGIVEALFEGLGVDDVFMNEDAAYPGRGIVVRSDGKTLGTIRHADAEKQWSSWAAEFDLERVLTATEEGKEYVPLKRFPAVMRDLSVLVAREVRIGDAMEKIEEASPVLIENVDLVDEYQDEKLGGRQSLTFRIVFQADDRTLTDAEVNGEMEKITVALRSAFRAEVR